MSFLLPPPKTTTTSAVLAERKNGICTKLFRYSASGGNYSHNCN